MGKVFVFTNTEKKLQRKIRVEEELSYRASLEDLYFQIHTKLKNLLPIGTYSKTTLSSSNDTISNPKALLIVLRDCWRQLLIIDSLFRAS